MLSIPAGLSTTTRSRSKNTIALSGRAPVRSFGARSSTTTTAPGETRMAESRQRCPFTVTRPSAHSSRARDHAAPVCSRTIAARVGGLVLRGGAGRGSRVLTTTPWALRPRRPLLDLGREQHLAAAQNQPVPGRTDDDLVDADVRRGFGNEAHHPAQIFHLEHARLVLGRRRLRPRFLQRRHRLARMDGAAADPVHAFLDVDLVDQGAQCLLARVVSRAAEIALIAGEPGRDVDHQAVAPLAHRGQHRQRARQRAVQVDYDDAIPLGRFEVLEEAFRDVGAGAIDEDVDAAVTREDRSGSAHYRLLVAGIDRLDLRFAAGLFDQRLGFGERRCTTARDDDGGPRFSQLDRGSLPDAAASARDPGDFSAQLFHHATASVVSRIGGKGESSAAQIARSNSASASVSLSSAIAAATQALMNRGFFSGASSFSSLRAPSTATMFSSEGERSTPPATPRAAIPLL